MDADNTFPAGLRVLAVDDDRICLKILERQLKYCNYNATVVTDARTALDMLRERKDEGNQFDLVISDVVMPNMDGFKLLELIGLEMDLPVIMLSANSETQTIIKGIKHGACDYMIKPVHLEQIRGIWTHVVKNSKIDPQNSINSGTNDDDVVQKLPYGDADKGEKVGEKHRKHYSKKNKKAVDVADDDNENTTAKKKQRVQWCGQLHRKFVEAVRQIGLERAVPKKILEIMNVEGLTRENVASHLQKYRIYLKKLGEGTLRNSSPFADETEAVRRHMNAPSFIGSPSSNNHFAKTNSSSAIGTQILFPTQSVHVMSSQKNLGIPRSNMEPAGHSVNLPKDAMPMPVQDISRFISSSKSYAPVSSGGLPGTSQYFPSGPSGSSFGNISNGVVLNASKPSSSIDISGSSFANNSNDNPPLTMNMWFSSSRSCSSYASILCGKILRSSTSRGIPFKDIADDEMMAPSGHLPLQSPKMVNQPSVELQSCSVGLSNMAAREVQQFTGPRNNYWKAVVPSRSSDHGDSIGTSVDPSQGDIFQINQLSRLAHSSRQIPTLTSNSALLSSSSTRPDLQIDNSAMLTQVLNGGSASGNLHEGSTVNQQAVSDQVNNINEFLMGTSDAQNAESDGLDDFLAYLVNQDFINNGDSLIDGNRKFAP